MKLNELIKEEEQAGFTIEWECVWEVQHDEEDEDYDEDEDEEDEDYEDHDQVEEDSMNCQIFVKCSPAQVKPAIEFLKAENEDESFMDAVADTFMVDHAHVSQHEVANLVVESLEMYPGEPKQSLRASEQFNSLESFFKFVDEQTGQNTAMDLGAMVDDEDNEEAKALKQKLASKKRYHPESLMGKGQRILKLS